MTAKIIGELITMEKYQFVDTRLLAAIVRDTVELIEIDRWKDKVK